MASSSSPHMTFKKEFLVKRSACQITNFLGFFLGLVPERNLELEFVESGQ